MSEDRDPLLSSGSGYGYGSTGSGVRSLDIEGEHDVIKDDKNVIVRRLVVLPIVFVYMFSFITAFATVRQYEYYAIAKLMFPGRSDWANISSTQCDVNTTSQDYKDQTLVQEATSQLNIYLSLAGGIPAIFSNLVFGTFSDKFGRKFLFILPTVGSFLRCLIVFLIMHFDAHVYYFVIAFLIEGCMGYFLGMLQAGFAYMADITAVNDKRSFAITMVEVSLGLGSFLGFLVSGYLIEWVGFQWTMLFSAGLLVIILIMVVFILPESMSYAAGPSDRTKSSCSNVAKYTGSAVEFYFQKRSGRKRWKYILCVLMFLLTTLTVLGRPPIETLVQLGTPFCWDSVKIGYYGTIRSGVQQVICLVLVRWLQCCMNDEGIAIAGTLSAFFSLVMEGFVTNSTSFYIGTYITSPTNDHWFVFIFSHLFLNLFCSFTCIFICIFHRYTIWTCYIDIKRHVKDPT